MKKINIKKEIICIISDFDGVLTDNSIFLNNKGQEFYKFNKLDSIAIDFIKTLNINFFFLSSETNNIIKHRAKKLSIKSYNGIKNKYEFILRMKNKNEIDFDRTIYIGNDLNDFKVMKLFKYRACPKDSVQEIKKICNLKLATNGGDGVIRELIKKIYGKDFINFFK